METQKRKLKYSNVKRQKRNEFEEHKMGKLRNCGGVQCQIILFMKKKMFTICVYKNSILLFNKIIFNKDVCSKKQKRTLLRKKKK